MSLDRAGDALWFAGSLVLLGSALAARRRAHPPQRMLVMALVWVAIFGLLFAIAHLIDTEQRRGSPSGIIDKNLT